MYGFEPIKIIRSEIFATLPEKYQQSGKGPRSATRQNKTGTTLEGPSFDRAGDLYFTDLANSRVFKAKPDRTIVLIAEYDGEPNGLKIHKDGRIIIADHHHGLMQLETATDMVKPYHTGPDKECFKGLNDLVFASNGDLYFTDQGATGLHDWTGRIFRLKVDGELQCVIDSIPGPNGLVLNITETIIYVVTRQNNVWQIPMTRNGGISKVGQFAMLPPRSRRPRDRCGRQRLVRGARSGRRLGMEPTRRAQVPDRFVRRTSPHEHRIRRPRKPLALYDRRRQLLNPARRDARSRPTNVFSHVTATRANNRKRQQKEIQA